MARSPTLLSQPLWVQGEQGLVAARAAATMSSTVLPFSLVQRILPCPSSTTVAGRSAKPKRRIDAPPWSIMKGSSTPQEESVARASSTVF